MTGLLSGSCLLAATLLTVGGSGAAAATTAMAAPVPLAQLLAEYRAVCSRHRELVASLDLDTPSKGELAWRSEPVTLRWILYHLLEETARHNGQLDILRELADGVRGK